MATVVPFYRFRAVEPMSAELIEIRDILLDTMSACPRCTGRGVVFFKRADGEPDFLPCPCGGTDADRVELDEVG